MLLDWTCLDCYGENKSEHHNDDDVITCGDCGARWRWMDIFRFGLNF